MHLHMYLNAKHVGTVDVDVMLDYGVRYQVLAKTQDHLDYLNALELMYGKKPKEMALLDQWKARVRQHRGNLGLLPVVFTTWRVKPEDELWMK